MSVDSIQIHLVKPVKHKTGVPNGQIKIRKCFGWLGLGLQVYCQTPVLGLGLEVDFTFAWDNDNENHNHNHNNNPHLNFMKGTVLGDKEQGVGIRDKG